MLPLFFALGALGLALAARRPSRGSSRPASGSAAAKPEWVRFQMAQAVRTCSPDELERVAGVLEPLGYVADGATLRHVATFIEQAHPLLRSRACAAVQSTDLDALEGVYDALVAKGELQAADIVSDIQAILILGGQGKGLGWFEEEPRARVRGCRWRPPERRA